MKKLGRCSDLYTSRLWSVRHRRITKKFESAVDISIVPEVRVRELF